MPANDTQSRKTITLYAPGAWEFFQHCEDIRQDGKVLNFTYADASGYRRTATIRGTWKIEDEP